MSKIITKEKLNLVIESTMKEAGLQMEENQTCEECGGTITEGMCNECGVSYMEEGNEFTKELSDAREEGKATFTVDGKTYKVEPADKEETDEIEESISELTESLSNTTTKEILKEELDFFNRIINYGK